MSECGCSLPITSPTTRGALHVPAVRPQAHVVHLEQDPAVHRLEPVPRVGQGARVDDRVRVLPVRVGELVGDVDVDDALFEVLVGLGGGAAACHLRAAPASRAAMRVTPYCCASLRHLRRSRGRSRTAVRRRHRARRQPSGDNDPGIGRDPVISFRGQRGPHPGPQVSGWTHAQLASRPDPVAHGDLHRRHRAQRLLPRAGGRGGRGRGRAPRRCSAISCTRRPPSTPTRCEGTSPCWP